MNEKFRQAVESLATSHERLLATQPITGDRFLLIGSAAGEKLRGVYLLSEADRHLYVGRSNDIASRFYAHRRTSSGDGVAAFAYRLACETSGRTAVSYRKGHSNTRAMKMADPAFLGHFAKAKERIRRMNFRAVLEPDPIRQALLEIYSAVALGTPYNSFDNH